ncbi:AAA family ATPase [Emticicia soli]|uniref:AAA family ATPase n=1 Tax=Emticicia soli TaxID=2027878 RepID=A0ABW5J422_9BACT
MTKKSHNSHKKKTQESTQDKPRFNLEDPENVQQRIRAHFEEISQQMAFDEPEESDECEDSETSKKDLLLIKSANDWLEIARTQPNPEMLFDEFWFEGEVCVLFADTNLGKSILAVQIGNSISKGEPIPGFRLGVPKQEILYLDFELSAKQFQNRYSLNFEHPYQFDENFKRIEINRKVAIPEKQSFEEFLIAEIERSLLHTNAKILIIDNLTYLLSEGEKSQHAKPFMKGLQDLADDYHLSLLLLAHTPKRDLTKPVNQNNMQGSKMLVNFLDSSFTISASTRDPNTRFLKQIKTRMNEYLFNSDNVAVCQINKPGNFLQFELIGFDSERHHMKEVGEKEKEKRIADALEMKKMGLNNTEIAKRFGVAETSVRRWLKKEKN